MQLATASDDATPSDAISFISKIRNKAGMKPSSL
jgi:hypothetical protein